jgi:hypothetical protein
MGTHNGNILRGEENILALAYYSLKFQPEITVVINTIIVFAA